MGSNEGQNRPVLVRILETSPAEAVRTAAVTGKLTVNCADPALYDAPDRCLEDLSRDNTDVLILDLEAIGGEEALEGFAVRCPATVLIAISSKGSVSRAVNAMRCGAHDFLTKPFSLDALASKINFQLSQRKPALTQNTEPDVASDVAPLVVRATKTATNQNASPLGQLIGSAPVMQDVYGQIERMAPSNAPVFITGESGTGKELCANAIHSLSDRANEKIVTINCAAIPRDLIESEIFGHVRGAFTGASESRAGAAEQADGGTLFLDEIGEMDLMLQSKLLRFLQTGTFQRLGDATTRKVDARIICATNRNPLEEVTAGRFREDLYYRLHVLPIQLPPLRQRREDIMELASTFLMRFCSEEKRNFKGFDADAEARLLAYNWPGNVRQLENTIRQIVVMNDGNAVTLGMLPMLIRDPSGRSGTLVDLSRERARVQAPSRPFGTIEPLWAQERRIIESALDAFDGNIAMAAAALEISPSTIYRKRQAWMERSC
ncbi:sigma-54-dependent transcriptional regulator [Roseibium sp.]|uniref:sigma-54-dependent transcriptional regulator n=1 Tax=Roseibium sp. TaxID=1936156 RepID=UPI003A97C0EB